MIFLICIALARKRIETAMATMSTDFQVRAMLGKIINEMASCEEDTTSRRNLWREAEEVLSQIIDDPMVDAGVRFNSVIILVCLKKMRICHNFFFTPQIFFCWSMKVKLGSTKVKPNFFFYEFSHSILGKSYYQWTQRTCKQ